MFPIFFLALLVAVMKKCFVHEPKVYSEVFNSTQQCDHLKHKLNDQFQVNARSFKFSSFLGERQKLRVLDL